MSRLHIRLVVSFLLVSIIFSFFPPVFQGKAKADKVIVQEDHLNVRTGPGTSYRAFAKLDQGETYHVLDKKGSWVKLRLNHGETGWVAKQYVIGVRKKAVVTADRLRVRSIPSSHGNIIGYLEQGQTVHIAETEDGWAKIVAPSFVGWVSSAYLASDGQQETTMRRIGWVTADSLNIRARPSLQAERVEKVTYGQQVQIMLKRGEWYQITTEDGKIGWVSSDYISIVSPATSQWLTVLYDDVNIRSAPSLDGNVKATARYGERYRVLGKIGNWYGIEIPGRGIGYIAGWLVSVSADGKSESKTLKGKTVVIDAGHGGKDSGARSVNGTMEKTLTLRTAKLLKEKLERYGANVVLTRSTDRYLSLPERVQTAYRYQADAFISIHYDSSKDQNAKGMTVYYYDMFSDYLLALSLEHPFSRIMSIPFRGVSFGDYHVIRENKLPSVLVELGYLSNPTEADIIATDRYQQEVTNAIANGLRNYFG
ncbi:N-acetylmuramoyl-L-alanine amidase [Geobacillus sp. 44B]|nr:N-acetylmuramoyl-L-alanine amidase [Geobacillus sp. 44B]QNU38896.1 N-acetylmuramoyl-L-alanine amidase [Geobacillus sp. 44B]